MVGVVGGCGGGGGVGLTTAFVLRRIAPPFPLVTGGGCDGTPYKFLFFPLFLFFLFFLGGGNKR